MNTSVIEKAVPSLRALALKRPKLCACVLGALAATAMAPTFCWPLMIVGLSGLSAVMSGIERPWRGAWTLFSFGMGYFTIGLWWIANALLIKIEDYWWMIGFSIFGLPALLSLCWLAAGWLTVRLSKPHSLARGLLLAALLALAEYGRAFNLTGFPWNLPGYMWGFSESMMQSAAIGGAYFTTALTLFWCACPALLWLARNRRPVMAGVALAALLSLGGLYAWGAARLAHNPTVLRDDFAVAIIQPNISQDEKWETDQVLDHFMRHVDIARDALATFKAPASLQTLALVWPETSLEERLFLNVPAAPLALRAVMTGHPYRVALVSGMWRYLNNEKNPERPKYFNSVGSLSLVRGKFSLDALYDKHHLVPFGEFLPMEQLLDLTPVVGFAGFQWGTGPKVLTPPDLPPFAPMICFEAIFPWYAHSPGADWLVNTSNDGWYGDTPGPYQHLTMTRFRALEQGKPLARSATTGISALIDPLGRVIKDLPYSTKGAIVSMMPAPLSTPTLYAKIGEIPFFAFVSALILVFLPFRTKGI